MDKEQIIAAGESAHALARELATILRRSDVPPAHWDEVLQRVSQIVSEHAGEHADDHQDGD